jgi:hypothetical protein
VFATNLAQKVARPGRPDGSVDFIMVGLQCTAHARHLQHGLDLPDDVTVDRGHFSVYRCELGSEGIVMAALLLMCKLVDDGFHG